MKRHLIKATAIFLLFIMNNTFAWWPWPTWLPSSPVSFQQLKDVIEERLNSQCPTLSNSSPSNTQQMIQSIFFTDNGAASSPIAGFGLDKNKFPDPSITLKNACDPKRVAQIIKAICEEKYYVSLRGYYAIPTFYDSEVSGIGIVQLLSANYFGCDENMAGHG